MAIIDQFTYPTQPAPLQELINQLLAGALPSSPFDGEVTAAIVPFSDVNDAVPATARAMKALADREFDTVVLVAPCRKNSFERIALCTLDTYQTPLGVLNVNTHMADELCDEDDDLFLDDTGHFDPRGIDAYLPFLQTIFDSFNILPIVMGDEAPMYCLELGNALGEISFSRRVLVLALASFEACDETLFNDIVGTLEAGDATKLMSLLNKEEAQITGKGPLAVALLTVMHQQEAKVSILDTQVPGTDSPGYITALLGN